MKERNKKTESKNVSVKKEDSRKFETMSQAQNRHGKGRERNGSDGGSQVSGNNH
jgi:hypothetical protein